MSHAKRLTLFFTLGLFSISSVAFAGELLSKEAVAGYNKGVEAQKRGDLDTAINEYRTALFLGVESGCKSSILNNMGAIYAQRGDFDRAEESFNQALAIDPAYKPAKLNLGLIYEKRGDKAMAMEYWAELFEEFKPKGFCVDTEKQTK